MIFDPTQVSRNGSDLESANEKEPTEEQIGSTTFLNGLRGLAALLVYISHHVAWWYGPDTAFEHGFGYRGEYMLATLPFLRTIFTGGSAAVALFFVMSGYVLSLSPLRMLKRGKIHETRSYLFTAIMRRPFRLLLPVAACSLAFVAVMHLPFGLTPELAWPKPEPTILAELGKWSREMARVANVFVPHTITTPWFPYNPPAWTMSAELAGSVCLFGLLAVSTSAVFLQRLALFAITGICLLLVGRWEIAAFMLGAAIAILHADRELILLDPFINHQSIVNHLVLFLGWYLVSQPAGGQDVEISAMTPGWHYLTLLTPPAYLYGEFWRFWTVVGATLLLYGVTSISWLQKLFDRPVFRYLGKISFALYLVHIPIAWVIGDRIARAFGKFRFDFTTSYDNLVLLPDHGPVGFSTGFLAWQALVFPINLHVASIVTKWVEEPSVKFGKRLTGMVQHATRH